MPADAQPFSICTIAPGDLAALHALSQTATEEVGDISPGDFDALYRQTAFARLARSDEDPEILGFVFALAPGAPYASPNYRWFEARRQAWGAPNDRPDFLYVDRIVVSTAARGLGVGAALYQALFAAAKATPICCEVNTVPPNPGSSAFHARLGFKEIGRAAHIPGVKEVAFYERRHPS